MGLIFNNPAQVKVVQFCADEIERQQDTPSHVYHMVRAWDIANATVDLNPEVIKLLGYLVKPSMNADWRTCEVVIGSGGKGAHWEHIPRLICNLFFAVKAERLSPLEIFQEFEDIHPFKDGNGRVGQIIYNWYNGTMTDPQWAAYKKP